MRFASWLASLLALVLFVFPSTALPRLAACPALSISPASGTLAAGQMNTPYSPLTIQVSGGSGNYSWSRDSGFPPGLSTSPALGTGGYGTDTRTLSGTPTAPGTYSFQLTATDWPEYPAARQGSCQVSAQYTLVVPASDLSVIQGAAPDPAVQGEPVTFDARAENAGPTDAAGVTLIDALPAGAQFVRASWHGQNASDSGPCTHAGRLVTCAIGALSAPNGGNEYADAVISAIAPSSGITIANEADVTERSYDQNTDDNGSTLVAELDPQLADLETTIAVPADTVAGKPLHVHVETRNHGPQDALKAGVNITIAATGQPVAGLAVRPSAGSCTLTAPSRLVLKLSCGFGAIAKGGRGVVAITFEASTGTVKISTQSGSFVTPDPSPKNNTARAVARVSAQ